MHDAPAFTKGRRVLGQQRLQVGFHPVLAKARIDAQLGGVVQLDLPDADLQEIAALGADHPHLAYARIDVGGRRTQIGLGSGSDRRGAGWAHPVQRLVGAVVGMHRNRSVRLHHDQPARHR
ncbi:hypothetical protein SDC9_178076 [bioreactor metagenome]|uniref:Uncharacterized protein n=1 Tax=bioreactor metagenome TaxID=1076179 RepID=A0A645GUZ8_9ZZZZ